MSKAANPLTVGIDLGTTHCVIAKGDPDEKKPGHAVTILDVPQLQAPGEVVKNPLLPSFLFLPGAHELPEGASDLPWGPSSEGVVGEMARRKVKDAPDRVVHSAKSWLCHDGVDRHAAFLPRSPAELDRRVSPVEASAAFLTHLLRSWDHMEGRGDRNKALAEQDILVTIPASFGEAARQLTVEAARAAGIQRLHLVEEPQAAFYSWLASHEANIDEALEGLELILVVDVGGGTTDLTLIRVTPDEDGDTPELERVAVGEHLMLGGDNMDLALAALAEPRLAKKGGRLDGRAWQALRQSCRLARETLLSQAAPDNASVVIPGRGSRLIGGQLKAVLSRQEVMDTVLAGFFPEVRADAKVETRQGATLREWGLPYAHDVAVTRHVAAFLRRYRKETKDQAPLSAVLFNGGVLNSERVANRLLDVIQSWTPKKEKPPRLLATRSLDLAVAVGAAHYGLVRRGRGLRILSGLPRAVYIGLEVKKKRKKGKSRLRKAALCLAPKGLKEGQEVELKDRPLNLFLGREVVFPLFEDMGKGGKPGEVRSADDPRLVRLPPIHTMVPGSGRRHVPVHLRARLSEVGTLEVKAAAQDGSRELDLEFDLRARRDGGNGPTEEEGGTEVGALDPDRMEQAKKSLEDLFCENPNVPKWKVLPRLEKILRSKRDNWPLSAIRDFYGVLRPDKAFYTGPPEITAAWYNLTGFCMRPGFGYPGDEARMELLQPVLRGGLTSWDAKVRAEWWILWRRVAGGLPRKTQQKLFQSVLSDAGKNEATGAQELIQMWMLAASLERVAVGAKRDFAEALMARIEDGHDGPPSLWCVGRLGARVPVHGGIEGVVPSDRAEAWLHRLLALSQGKRTHYALALFLLSRRTDDRSRDIPDDLRDEVIERLRKEKAPVSWIKMVETAVEDEPLDSGVLGESLPPGLRLLG